MQVWRLDDSAQTIVVASIDNNMAFIAYWGAVLPEHENLAQVVHAQMRDLTGGMIDQNAPVSLCPVEGDAFPGMPALVASDASGIDLMPCFTLRQAHVKKQSLELIYVDKALGLTYSANINSAIDGVWQLTSQLDSEVDIKVHWLAAPVLPCADKAPRVLEFGGRWCGEFKLSERSFGPSALVRENRTGRTGHEHFPGLMALAQGANYCQGDVYAWHYGWSGGHKMVAEQLPDGRRQVQFGHVPHSHRALAKTFSSANQYIAFSAHGINGVSVPLQKYVREQLLPFSIMQKPRPVHYNCWEAIYFDHDVDLLKDLASRAAGLGAERFVLDDGWFGKRDDDTTSLGDWDLDIRKYPHGLTPLIEHVQSCGMGFGLWFEPEMVNEESNLYKAHPQWVLGRASQTRGRQQLVLNIALPAVQEYLYTKVSHMLANNAIEYIKWDHNRVLPFADVAQTQAIYGLLSRLRVAFPHVEIESCSSGGARIDYGVLEHTQRVWLSDSNDALERLRIQHQAATFLPAIVTGSHVGPRHCHTSGRVHSMNFRAWVAAQRHMGMEMDPRELTTTEADQLRQVVTFWKQQRDWLLKADILRLDSHDKAVLAELHLAATGEQFVVFAGVADSSAQISPRPLPLTGLDAKAQYEIDLVNRDELVSLSRGEMAIKVEKLTLSGSYLMNYGVTLPWQFPNAMWVLKGKRL
ncbi:alpha-galactosidase [Oceanospirillaceae bacterium]|nr:alpha-galactosidase [Oceanospirillaceae bacterium]MDB9972758.1 alpha-galactosidase [Oceanospirillaceae bacterium]